MSTNNRFLSVICAATIATGLLSAPPIQAQTAPSKAPITQPLDSNTASVTIFGHKRPLTVRSFSQISSRSASSCSFMSGNAAAEDIIDSYLGSFGYDNGDQTLVPAAVPTDPDTGQPMADPRGGARARVNDRAVFGDASQRTGDLGYTNPADMSGGSSGYNMTTSVGNAGGCTTADAAFAAGRNFILRNDKTLRDALAAYRAKDYPAALALFEKSYNKIGYDEAGLMLARMYMDGQGTAPDINKAIFWLKKVAETPYPDYGSRLTFDPHNPYDMDTRTQASMALARIYMLGTGVPVDAQAARKWFLHADDGGYIPATHIAGQILLRGYGGPRDVKGAIAHFKRAGQLGFAPSQYALGELYYDGDDGVPADKTLAGAWLLLAAKRNHPDALYAVGRMYELGEGGAKVDPARALVSYKEAAVLGQAEAQNVIGTDFYLGTGLDKNLEYARKWFLRSAENGNADAMFNLGVMMVNGEGGPKDSVHAYAWFSLAQKGGVEKATPALAELASKMTAEERAQADALLNPKT